MWTCRECGREFANTHQWHSCTSLSLEAALSASSDHARLLYLVIEQAVGDCGPFRVHPQKTRIAFITTMTFAGVKLAQGWVDLSFIMAEPIDDPRISGIECFGPTSFRHVLRIHDPEELDSNARSWLCRSWRRGNQETIHSDASVRPITGTALKLVVVPLRAQVVEHGEDLALKIPRYAAELFAGHPLTTARVFAAVLRGTIETAEGRWLFCPSATGLQELGLGVGEAVDALIRADL